MNITTGVWAGGSTQSLGSGPPLMSHTRPILPRWSFCLIKGQLLSQFKQNHYNQTKRGQIAQIYLPHLPTFDHLIMWCLAQPKYHRFYALVVVIVTSNLENILMAKPQRLRELLRKKCFLLWIVQVSSPAFFFVCQNYAHDGMRNHNINERQKLLHCKLNLSWGSLLGESVLRLQAGSSSWLTPCPEVNHLWEVIPKSGPKGAVCATKVERKKPNALGLPRRRVTGKSSPGEGRWRVLAEAAQY